VSGPLRAKDFAHCGFSSLGVMFRLVKIYEVRVHLDDLDFQAGVTVEFARLDNRKSND
jgi:hypothetical protein